MWLRGYRGCRGGEGELNVITPPSTETHRPTRPPSQPRCVHAQTRAFVALTLQPITSIIPSNVD